MVDETTLTTAASTTPANSNEALTPPVSNAAKRSLQAP